MRDRDGDGGYDRFTNIDPGGRLASIELPASASVEEALEALRRDPSVEYAEPNDLVETTWEADPAR